MTKKVKKFSFKKIEKQSKNRLKMMTKHKSETHYDVSNKRNLAILNNT
jgi:hypothetical protein